MTEAYPLSWLGISKSLVTGVSTPLAADLIRNKFRSRAKEMHGTGADMDRLVKARDKALEKINA